MGKELVDFGTYTVKVERRKLLGRTKNSSSETTGIIGLRKYSKQQQQETAARLVIFSLINAIITNALVWLIK